MSVQANIRLPFVYGKYDPSKAFEAPAELEYNGLIMGQMLDSITTGDQIVFQAYTADEVAVKAGNGSMAHRMAIKWFLNNKSTPTDVILLKDPVSGNVKADGLIAFTGPATDDGVYYVEINGITVPTVVVSGDTAIDVANNVVIEINLITELPVTAVFSGVSDVTLDAKNAGTNGNFINVAENVGVGQTNPEGIATVVTPMANGAGVVDIDDVLNNIGDKWYHIWTSPWIDAANITKLDAELEDRFGEIRMIDGMAFISTRGTPGALVAFGNSNNSPHISCPHCEGIAETPEEFAAGWAAQVAFWAQADPARPFQTLKIAGFTPPKPPERFEWSDNNNLLFNGISTWKVDNTGSIRIARSITFYQLNEASAPDIAYLNCNTLFTLMFMRYDFRTFFPGKYPRAKKAGDSDPLPVGQSIVTPNLVKTEVVNMYKRWVQILGIAEETKAFTKSLIVVASDLDPDRIDVFLKPDLINQFRVLTGVFQFILHRSSTAEAA